MGCKYRKGRYTEWEGQMKNSIKEEVLLCEICGYPIIHNEYGSYQTCPKCGWRRGGDNTELEQQWGISYPMLVSLSHAREQYRQGLQFKADFDEFIRGLFFYSEMLFDHEQTTYEVFLIFILHFQKIWNRISIFATKTIVGLEEKENENGCVSGLSEQGKEIADQKEQAGHLSE